VKSGEFRPVDWSSLPVEPQLPSTALVVVIDVSALVDADQRALDALARLQLAAHRVGTSIRLQNACGELVDLLALVGLSDVLPVAGGEAVSGVEVYGQVEQRKELRIDEVVDRGDASA
jgi:ABC-type transporter Mla MlaB component